MTDCLPAGSMTIGINNRQHFESGASILFTVNPGYGEEMGQLPKRKNRKQSPTFNGQLASRGSRPTHERWESARDRADSGVEPGHAFERSVNEQIAQKRDGADNAGGKIYGRGEIDQANDRRHPAHKQYRLGLQTA